MGSRAVIEVLAFVSTYLVHSTLLLGLAWAIARCCRSLELRERIWKAALFGGLVTAASQAGLGWRTPLAHWTLRPEPVAGLVEFESVAPERPGADSVAPAGAASPRVVLRASDVTHTTGEGSPAFLDVLATTAPAERGPRSSGVRASSEHDESRPLTLAAEARAWAIGGLWAWATLATLVVSGYAAMAVRLAWRLRGSRELSDGPLRARLDELVRGAFGRALRVRLVEAPGLTSPLSHGVLRRTICVPPRVASELQAGEQAALLAHELAHLARRDPLWLAAAWWVERVFFFQPLNRVARGRLLELAELACDDWAVRRTGERLALASCLTRVAGWLAAQGRAPSTPATTAMAQLHGRSSLARRVERLLDAAPTEFGVGARRWSAPALCVALVALGLLAPGVAADRSREGAARVQTAPVRLAARRPEFVALEESLAELRSELDSLRAGAAAGEAGPALLSALDELEARLASLELRRARLESNTAARARPDVGSVAAVQGLGKR